MRASLAAIVVACLDVPGSWSAARAQQPLARGDANGDRRVDISDPIFSLGCQFLGTRCPDCMDAGDSNDDGRFDLGDAIWTLSWIFRGGPIPPEPGPFGCGPDPTQDDLTCLQSNCADGPTGVCCPSYATGLDAPCAVSTAEDCAARGGLYGGDGSACAQDCDQDGLADACELDCNSNGVPDDCDLAQGTSQDCNTNGVPDDCEPDCNQSGAPDDCELADGRAADCDQNGLPDACDLLNGSSSDCNSNGIPDACDLAACTAADLSCRDCNGNGVPDACDLAACAPGDAACDDCDGDGALDGCGHCVIPGDLNGDFVVDAADQPLFDACLSRGCGAGSCECADFDGDGNVGAGDADRLRAILAGQEPASTIGISSFHPRRAAAGDIVTIEGVGFGNNPDDLCIVAMQPGSTTAIPFQAVTATDTRIEAEVGPLEPGDRPAPLMVVRGRGARVALDVPPGVVAPGGGWVWQLVLTPSGIKQMGVNPQHFDPDPISGPGVITGQLVAGSLCLTLPKGCRAGTKLTIQCRAWDHTPNPDFGVDGYIPSLVINSDMTALQCAQAICTAITSLFLAQTPPVVINCNAVQVGNGAKITLTYPSNTITWGVLKVVVPYIEVQVNNTPATNDDYVTWSPTFCRARIIGLVPAGPDCNVVLTNDTPNLPGGGDLLFAPFLQNWPANTTATQPSIALTLPASGAWVPFAIAGQYGMPSTNDKDAVIEVHEGTPTGPIAATHALMVRVRKDAETLTPAEITRYVNAVNALSQQNKFVVFQWIHSVVSGGGNTASQAYGNSAFLPWFRTLILEYERQLQAIDPSVSAHYWDCSAPAPVVFGSSFMGSTNLSGLVTTGAFTSWSIQRAAINHAAGAPCASDASVLSPTTYAAFRQGAQANPSSAAHAWVGGWMASVFQAAQDPLFFLLHSNIDRLWARWQAMGHQGTSFYAPQVPLLYNLLGCTGTFIRGEYLADSMWPWDQITGGIQNLICCPNCINTITDNRPLGAPGGTLDPPAAPGFVLGPPVVPAGVTTVQSVIDYLGYQSPQTGLGYCYDDTAY